jgi:hypothetical protein
MVAMKAWSASALDRYYSDPVIMFLRTNDHGGGAAKAGYYIVPHCDPDCCAAFGGVSTAELGPFSTRVKARQWSRTNLRCSSE